MGNPPAANFLTPQAPGNPMAGLPILDNEDRILGWCDSTATRLGVQAVDLEKYFTGVIASV